MKFRKISGAIHAYMFCAFFISFLFCLKPAIVAAKPTKVNIPPIIGSITLVLSFTQIASLGSSGLYFNGTSEPIGDGIFEYADESIFLNKYVRIPVDEWFDDWKPEAHCQLDLENQPFHGYGAFAYYRKKKNLKANTFAKKEL